MFEVKGWIVGMVGFRILDLVVWDWLFFVGFVVFWVGLGGLFCDGVTKVSSLNLRFL